MAEIIIVDDGSTDATLAVARGFEPHVRVFTGPNQGVSAARNRGISETSSEWVLFLDADDLLLPGTLERRLAMPEVDQSDVIVCDWQDLHDDGIGDLSDGSIKSIDWPALRADPEIATATHVWATTAALLYRRDVVSKIGGFRSDLPVIQDARFLFDAAHHGARFIHAPHVGARYRQLPQSLSRRDPARFWQDVLINGQQIETLWRMQGTLGDARRQALMNIFSNAGRGLFGAGHPSYRDAVAAQRSLNLPMPLHSRIAAPLMDMFGMRVARHLLSLLGRS